MDENDTPDYTQVPKATANDLGHLLGLVTKSLNSTLERDLQDNIPTDAATLGAAIKLLANNSITADPAAADDLHDLRKNLEERRQARKSRIGNVVAMVKHDVEAVG